MFWKTEKPKNIPDPVGSYLVTEKKEDPDWVWHLKAVVQQRLKSKTDKSFNFRIFSEVQAIEKGIKVENWAALDEHPDLILYEGWFDKNSRKVELTT
ncbi:MAG: hypothetical protein KAV98_06015 [Dehalococcoidia bacterium]|nr:hypothetical protein [Dehalococcoidia bacterium]